MSSSFHRSDVDDEVVDNAIQLNDRKSGMRDVLQPESEDTRGRGGKWRLKYSMIA